MFETYPRTLRTDRLYRLAQKLEGAGPYLEYGPIPWDKWTFREWFRWTIKPTTVDPTAKDFAADAIGWAATDPWFQAEGLVIKDLGYKAVPSHNDRLGFAAVQTFFGLTPSESDWLFWIGSYEGVDPWPEIVASRIYEFIGRQIVRAAA